MERLFTAVDRTMTFIGRAAGQFYLLLTLVTVYEVALRYFFNAPTNWAFEIALFLCGMAWLLSVGYVTQQKGHIAITIAVVMAPKPVQWWLEAFSETVTLIVVCILTYACWPLMRDAIQMGERSGTAFNSPEPIVIKTFLVVGAAMYAIQTAANLARHLKTYGVWRR